MTSSRKSSAILSGTAEWFEPTPGERFTIRTSSTEAEGNFTILAVVADPRNVAMHIHKNEDEHFIVLEGTYVSPMERKPWTLGPAPQSL